ncbi:MAG: universal stress protein [Betaproteobacteria bacterium]|nr:universal stress protein [Betaproteobacteria bacterium]
MQKRGAAGTPYACPIGVGDPAPAIAKYAADTGVDPSFMGIRGRGTAPDLLAGSVGTRVIHQSR